ncbi:hypothetical protein ACO1O0_001486 [Amphichorda felina]
MKQYPEIHPGDLPEFHDDLLWSNAVTAITSGELSEDLLSDTADYYMVASEDSDNTLVGMDPKFGLENGLDDLFSSPLVPPPPPEQADGKRAADRIETDMRELAELNLKAYRMTKVTGIKYTIELIVITRAILGILGRVTATVQQQEEENRVCAVSNGRRHPRLPSPVLHDYTPRMTTSLILQAVSCCEQILDAFTHVCSDLYAQLVPQARSAGGNNNGNGNSGDDDCSLSTARAVMTVELINHLYEKLSRGQKQVLKAAPTADSFSPSSPNLATPTSEYSESSTTATDRPTAAAQMASDSSASIIAVLLQRAHGRHPHLEAYIRAIRDLTRRNDGV